MAMMAQLGILGGAQELSPPPRALKPRPAGVPFRRGAGSSEGPTERRVSSRSQGRKISYAETWAMGDVVERPRGHRSTFKSNRGAKRGGPVRIASGPRPEVYTRAQLESLSKTRSPWELFRDGYGKDGKRIYDPVNGKCCHQCRQKTLGTHTTCHECQSGRGQFCGDCLMMRYGECVLDAQKDPKWRCPSCRDLCNCSFCRSAKGWAPTGNMYRAALGAGYDSVAHMLVTLYQDDNQTPSGAVERSLRAQIETLPKRKPKESTSKPASLSADGKKEDAIGKYKDKALQKAAGEGKGGAKGRPVRQVAPSEQYFRSGNVVKLLGAQGARQTKRGRAVDSIQALRKDAKEVEIVQAKVVEPAKKRGRPRKVDTPQAGKSKDYVKRRGRPRNAIAPGRVERISGLTTLSPSEIDDIPCEECSSKSHASLMLLCDGCDGGYHTFCIGLGKAIPDGDFFCKRCISDQGKAKNTPMIRSVST